MKSKKPNGEPFVIRVVNYVVSGLVPLISVAETSKSRNTQASSPAASSPAEGTPTVPNKSETVSGFYGSSLLGVAVNTRLGIRSLEPLVAIKREDEYQFIGPVFIGIGRR